MTEHSDDNLTSSRRTLLKQGVVAGGVIWAAPTIDSFLTNAAAASGTTTATSSLFKAGSGQTDPTNTTMCTTGAQSGAARGSVSFTRNGNATITASATLSTGSPSQVGRDVFILQANATTCVGGDTTPVGTWAASPANGPQVFTAAIIAGATRFTFVCRLSGGGGNDGTATNVVSLP